jgi:hypothetical protein
MGEVITIGLDIAKSVFQVHGVDVAGLVVIHKRIGRAKMLEYFGGLPRCLVGIEACPSAHHWIPGLDPLMDSAHPSDMKHIPSLIGVIVLFGIVYFLTEATLTTLHLVFGIAWAVLVYSAIMAWHIRNLLG